MLDSSTGEQAMNRSALATLAASSTSTSAPLPATKLISRLLNLSGNRSESSMTVMLCFWQSWEATM